MHSSLENNLRRDLIYETYEIYVLPFMTGPKHHRRQEIQRTVLTAPRYMYLMVALPPI